jgi:hypothetical protein
MANLKPLLRWTVARAAVEFNLHKDTVAKYLRREGIRPGPDGKFSTIDVITAVYGNLRSDQTREARARADKLELEVALLKKRAIPTERVFQFLQNCLVAIKSKITSSHLSEIEQHQILNDLVSLKDADL